MAQLETTIPKGSLVLVTGATGYVATHVIQSFLTRGYKVRGTVRNLEKASWLTTSLFQTYAAAGSFSLIHVPTLADPHAFDAAVKGVSAIAHVASVVTFDSDPAKVIPQTVLGATSILSAALNEPSVKSFVFTSSIVASAMPVPGNTTHVTHDTFNETAIALAWTPPATGGVVYMASKAAAEKAVWDFVAEKKPHFSVNTVAPATIIGQPLHQSHLDSAGHWLKPLFDGKGEGGGLSTIFTVDVKDVGVLHAAAVLDPEVKGARLQAWADNTNLNRILTIMRRQFPDRIFSDDFEGIDDNVKLELTADFSQPLSLLKKWAGQEGWTPLEQTIREDIEGIIAFSE